MNSTRNTVAVIGGGISGLVSAYRLLKEGYLVTLFEASDGLGGLGGDFLHDGQSLEQFYHVMATTDENLLDLLTELEIDDGIVWKETRMGFLFGEKVYPFNSPLDVLRFGGLSLTGRIRTIIGGAYIVRFCNDPKGLDRLSVADWLQELFGAEVFEKLWRPMLRAKFGEKFETVPAYWFWTHLRRGKGSTEQVKGYPVGGYRRIADRLQAEILRLGGVIRMKTPVSSVEDAPKSIRLLIDGSWEPYEMAVSTLPLPVLRQLAGANIHLQLPQNKLAYQGVANAVAILKQQLQPNFWNAIVNKAIPFQGLIETTHVVPRSQTGGRHLVYLLNYCDKDSDTYRMVDGDVKFQAIKAMKAFNPKFSEDWVEDIRVFRAPYVEPVWPLGYQHNKPRMRCGSSRLYLATTAQCYPKVNSWDTMIGIANDVAARMHFDINNIHAVEAIKRPPHTEALPKRKELLS